MSALPHLASDFFAWLWFATEQSGGQMTVGDEEIRIWIDDRLSFRSPSAEGSRTVLTGDDAPRGGEARAALVSGKVLREIRLRLGWREIEYALTLRAPDLDIAGLVLPPVSGEAGDDADTLFARMEAVEEIWGVLGALYRVFAEVRTSSSWGSEVVPDLTQWLNEAP